MYSTLAEAYQSYCSSYWCAFCLSSFNSVNAQYSKIKTKADLEPIKHIKTFNLGTFDHNTENVDTVMKHIFNTLMPLDITGNLTYICTFQVAGLYRAIIQPYSNRNYGSAIVFGYGTGLDGIFFYVKSGGILRRYKTTWTATTL